MSDGALHSTKRELQRMFFAPRFWAVLMGAALVLGMVGPFGTFDSLALLPRLAYWTAISIATFFAAIGSVYFLLGLIFRDRQPGPFAFAVAGAAAGFPVLLIVLAFNSQVFGPSDGDDVGPLALLAYCMAISATVSVLIAVFSGEREPKPAAVIAQPSEAEAGRPKILERLPVHLRGRLIRMSMQDHYVEVQTDKGKTLVLLRLADAIGEAGGVPGLQIHRSHWVALRSVGKQVRKEGRLFLELEDGSVLPVSRSFMAAARAAGLG